MYQYIPSTGDLVVVNVHHSSAETYHCAITPHTAFATLPQLSFEGATKKTRPVLAPGALVYARIASASKHMDPELECIHPSTGKSEGLGPLKGGMLFEITVGMARRLMMGEKGCVGILEGLAEKARFEVAIGRNGRLWVDSDNVRTTLAVGKAVVEVDDKGLGIEEQTKLVGKVLRGI